MISHGRTWADGPAPVTAASVGVRVRPGSDMLTPSAHGVTRARQGVPRFRRRGGLVPLPMTTVARWAAGSDGNDDEKQPRLRRTLIPGKPAKRVTH